LNFENKNDFWQQLENLVNTSEIVVDRPKGSTHPRYPSFFYPVDYGYLKDTTAMDGNGIDIWIGSLPNKKIMAVICTVDMIKRDSEIKILLGCTDDEKRAILALHNSNFQSGLLIHRTQ
jgi:inorganic pyrophosphatase